MPKERELSACCFSMAITGALLERQVNDSRFLFEHGKGKDSYRTRDTQGAGEAGTECDLVGGAD